MCGEGSSPPPSGKLRDRPPPWTILILGLFTSIGTIGRIIGHNYREATSSVFYLTFNSGFEQTKTPPTEPLYRWCIFWTYAHPSYCPSDLPARGFTAAR